MQTLLQRGIFLTTLFTLLFSSLAIAQKGNVRGTVMEEDSGEPVLFGNVLIVGTGSGTTTDLDGKYDLSLSPGMYTLEFSYIGFANYTVENIEVKADEVTLLDVILSAESELLEEIVVTAKQARNTEQAILTIQKKSTNLLDGISSQSFRRIGDSDAAGAIKRVTGVSVEGGKYVFVRGLGDRYTKSVLNGSDIPGLDPDRNTLQMDIFPTNLIDNILVVKSFTPDLPGDFTGGIVNIVTKDFPEERRANIGFSLGYAPKMHFNSNYLRGPYSQTDFLGFDNGLRDLPIDPNAYIPNPIERDPTLFDQTNAFNPRLAAIRGTSGMNYSANASFGNQYKVKGATLGFNAALNYKNNTEFYEDAQFNTYRKNPLTDVNELEEDRTIQGNTGTNNVYLSGLVGGAIKFDNHKVSLNVMRLQNGQNRGGKFIRQTYIRNSNTLVTDNVEYSERSLTNINLNGKHVFSDGSFELGWKFSPTFSSIRDKDVRVTPFRFDDGVYTIEPSEGAQPSRIFRDLTEDNYSGGIDLTKKLKINNEDSKIKFGAYGVAKNRDYGILNYRIDVRGQSLLDINGDPDLILADENLWSPQTGIGSYIIGNFEPANSYNATQNTLAAYAMHEMSLTQRLKIIYGLRIENFVHKYTGQNNLGDRVFDNEELLSSTDLLPSVNLIYSVDDNTNIRASYSKTLARPSFKELSIAQIYDALTDRTFIGNTDLEQTDIDNVDLRIERFLSGGQIIAVSGFYKNFKNPIEIVAFSEAAPNNLTPRNVSEGKVYGIEIEARKNFDFISEELRSLTLGANVTLVHSEVVMDDSEGGEYESRLRVAREGEVVEPTRVMQGQSPYIVNAFLAYNGFDNGWEANLSYNVQGSRLSVVGIALNPDVYENPFHSVNFKMSKSFGETKRARISLSANNLLSQKRLKYYESFGAEKQIFEQYIPGREFKLGFSYAL